MLWVSLAGTLGFFLAALIVRIVDGDWEPVRAYIEPSDGGHVARWFAEGGGVREVPLSHADEQWIGARDTVDAYARRGSRPRLRLGRVSPAVRGLMRVGTLLAVVAVLAFAVPWIMLATEISSGR